MKKLTTLFVAVLCICNAIAQGTNDYYHVPTPIKFNNTSFYLSDSYHPQEHYYKQEYIPKGEKPDRFVSMFTIDLLTQDISLKDAVQRKAQEIEAVKPSDPMAHYKIYEQPEKGEYMIDFLLSSIDNGTVKLVEWNIYRYTTYKDKNGKSGLLLIIFSKRAYGNDVKPFLLKLKDYKAKVINEMGAFKIPAVSLAN